MPARFIKPSQHMQLNENYYTHYCLCYTYYFECLTRIEQLVTSTYALQANIQRNYERYHTIKSRRKLSLLAHGPNPCHFLLYYSHYVTIISYYTHYFRHQNAIWVRINCRKLAKWLIHHWRSVRIKPRASRTQLPSTKVSTQAPTVAAGAAGPSG